ncbi:MAG: adenylate/guanylate cyclase domain-containing protein [Thermodesulfobacteriota bacterium]
MDNQGIMLAGRGMRHAPWTVDSQGCYRPPSEKESTEVYGIAGTAVRETLLYFEQCRGSTPDLVDRLNRHVPGDRFFITRAGLLDEDRWYTHEYYFYFQMFCKQFIGRFDWHFGEYSTAQLSEHHKIWEKGPLRYIPYGGPEKDSTFSMIRAMLDHYTEAGVDFSDLYDWAEALCREKTGISFKNVIVNIKNIWLCSEFWYYLIEFVKIIANVSSTTRIVEESFDHYELEGFSFAPDGMLIHLLTYMLNRSTRAYHVRVDYAGGNRATFELTRRPDWNADKTDKYFASATRNGDEAIIAAYRLIIRKFLRLDVPPEVTRLSGVSSGEVTFTIAWPRRLLPVPAIPLILANGGLAGLYALTGPGRPVWLALGLVAVSSGLLLYRHARYARNRVHTLKQRLSRTISANEAKIEQAERIARDLLEEKKRLLAERREIIRRMEIVQVYTRKSLVDIIAAGDDPTCFPSTHRMVSVLFADINDFTRWSEKRSSMEIVDMLNRYFNEMNRHIISENGEIDKLIGDGLMAVFTDPDSCLRAAVRMCGGLRSLNGGSPVYRERFFHCGIGINYGQVVVGNIGSENKMDYTVIGDIVNAASRLEALTRYYQADIIISEEFKTQLSGNYRLQFLDMVQVKGRQAPTRIYEVYDHLDAEALRLKQAVGPDLDKAFACYQRGDFESALSIYDAIRKRAEMGGRTGRPLRLPLKFYRDRCRELLARRESGGLDRWTGIYDFTIK